MSNEINQANERDTDKDMVGRDTGTDSVRTHADSRSVSGVGRGRVLTDIEYYRLLLTIDHNTPRKSIDSGVVVSGEWW